MTMKNPPHPALSVRHDCIEPLGLTITEAAQALGVTRQTLNNLVNGKSGISADMAIRLDKAFGGGAETWLRLQMASTPTAASYMTSTATPACRAAASCRKGGGGEAKEPILLREPLYKLGGWDDRDLSEWVESKQIGVAGDDRIGMTLDRQFEKLVVGGIAALGNPLDNSYWLGAVHQSLQPSPSIGGDQRNKVRKGHHSE
jgi:addiction module HigA family antidote